MHFHIDKDNTVKRFHIEIWDRQALGTELTDKINSYSGKTLDAFLKFVLKEKLFLRLKMMFMIGNNETVYFWASSVCFGPEIANQLFQATKAIEVKGTKYAIIKIKKKGQSDKIMPVLREDVLASIYNKFNYPSKEFLIEMTPEDATDISIAFNISRNRQNIIRNHVKGMEDKTFMQMQLKGVKFVGIKKNMTLDIIDDKVINEFSKKDVEQYLALVPTSTDDENEIKEIEKTIKKIKKLAENKED